MGQYHPRTLAENRYIYGANESSGSGGGGLVGFGGRATLLGLGLVLTDGSGIGLTLIGLGFFYMSSLFADLSNKILYRD